MARTSWPGDSAHSSFHLLTGRLHGNFAGGALEAFDGARLRFAANLMKRSCSKLGLRGTTAVQGGREDAVTVVHVAISNAEDFNRLNALTGSVPVEAHGWKAQSRFILDKALYKKLLEVAGMPDGRGAGRRARERLAADMEDRSLRWKVSGRSSS